MFYIHLQFDKISGWNVEDVKATHYVWSKISSFIWTIRISCHFPSSLFPSCYKSDRHNPNNCNTKLESGIGMGKFQYKTIYLELMFTICINLSDCFFCTVTLIYNKPAKQANRDSFWSPISKFPVITFSELWPGSQCYKHYILVFISHLSNFTSKDSEIVGCIYELLNTHSWINDLLRASLTAKIPLSKDE